MTQEREVPQPEESILDQGFVETVLGAAQVNLEKDGELVPALFLKTKGGEHMVVVLQNFPGDSEEKRMYLTALGIALDSGLGIREAVFLSEVWYVEEEKEGADFETRPSQHPKRREAIAVMGRNRDGSRLTHVLQPFHRDEQNQPVFEEVAVAEYNIPTNQTPQAFGLLDYLFG